MPRPNPTASILARGISVVGLAGLAVITFASPGATRMHAFPWTWAYAAALVTPAIVLVLRVATPRRPFVLPRRRWFVVILATGAIITASAILSPYRAASVLWSAPLLSGLLAFLVVCDWLQNGQPRAERFATALPVFLGAVALASLVQWAADLPGRSFATILDARNPYPLGHSSYTAGLALLGLPLFVALAWRRRGAARAWWVVCVGLALGMLVTSASRGALLGLGVLAFIALLVAPIQRKLVLTLVLAAAGLGLALAHPRTRALFTKPDPAAPPNISNVQRTAMLTAAWRMGQDRPLLGWGPGTTPLAFPRYRAGLDGGAENVLQLHCTPAHLWAELGAAGVLVALGFVYLVARDAKHHPVAAAALAGYSAFALTDWQLDVPVFTFTLAGLTALVATAKPRNPAHLNADARQRILAGGAALVAIILVALVGRRDPAPSINVRALALARDPANSPIIIALLRDSLRLNPHQEIVHFNLGWLLVGRDPALAETHFLAAARLVPDKGGVYLGLGLARLNQKNATGAARALALECLNDPAFLASPWWREPALAAVRDATRTEFLALATRASRKLPAGSWAAGQLAALRTRADGLGIVASGPERTYYRERTGYPVLMRNLDLPPPTDVFLVRERAVAPNDSLPAKGWLPSPLLLEWLDAPVAPDPKPKSETRK